MKPSITLLIFSLFACVSQAQQKGQKPPDTAAVYEFKKGTADGTGKFYLGREIARVMGTAGAGWLERSNRQQEEDNERTIAMLPLDPESVVADIGAGTGYYTFRVAPKIPGGKIYAVEIQDEFIDRLNQRKHAQNAGNVQVVRGSEQSPNLPPGTVDVVFMVDVYHELLYPHEMLQAIHKALKPGGKLALIEYKAEDPEVSIKPLHKMSVLQVNKELTANGFKLVKKDDSLPIQHFLLFEKD